MATMDASTYFWVCLSGSFLFHRPNDFYFQSLTIAWLRAGMASLTALLLLGVANDFDIFSSASAQSVGLRNTFPCVEVCTQLLHTVCILILIRETSMLGWKFWGQMLNGKTLSIFPTAFSAFLHQLCKAEGTIDGSDRSWTRYNEDSVQVYWKVKLPTND